MIFLGVYINVLFRDLVKDIKSTTYATHSLYMYPAKFIPQVIRYAISRYTDEGDWIFDPFAGYGSVAIEASLTGRNAILWDLNPITRILALASTYKGDLSLKDFELDWDYVKPFIPRWDHIDYWHPPEFLKTLSRVWGYWHNEVHGKVEDSKAYLIAIPLLKVTRFFSYSDEKIAKLYRSKYAEEKVKGLLSRDWRRLMVEKYWEHAKKVLRDIEDYQSLKPKNIKIIVEASWRDGNRLSIIDSLNKSLNMRIKLMITSPPYLQAQEYIRSFKLELSWLGYSGSDLRMLSSKEIPYNTPPNVRVESEKYWRIRGEVERLKHPKLLKLYDAYFKSLAHFLNNNHKMIEDTIAMFVGPVKIRNIRVPIDEILKEHLESLGWKHEATLIDTIVARRLFRAEENPATGLEDERTPTEHLLIMRKT